MPHPNAIMATSSADRINNSGVYQPYQNFRVQTLGGNIVQGQLNKIQVAEVMFPYDLPTIVQGQNDTFNISVFVVAGATGVTTYTTYSVTLPPQFYTATELTAALTATLTAVPGGVFTDLTLNFDPITQAIYFVNSGVWDPAGPNYIYAPLLSLPTAAGYTAPSLLWTLGFKNLYAQFQQGVDIIYPTGNPPPNDTAVGAGIIFLLPENYVNAAPNPVFPTNRSYRAIVGTPYNGRYTDYIDICSPTLCQAQYVRDGNTQQFVVHRDIICRLYIASEVSLFQTDPLGTRPFVIHRQFKNAKVMKWTADRSIDAIDIQLYDQYGNPLPNIPPILIADLDTIPLTSQGFSGSRDFSITFLVDEPGAEEQEQNIGYRY